MQIEALFDASGRPHLVLLEEPLDTAGQSLDSFVLLGHHRGKVDRHILCDDAVRGEMLLGVIKLVGRVQESLRVTRSSDSDFTFLFVL